MFIIIYYLTYLLNIINAPKVILITIDGARWQEIYQGTDPALDQGKHLSAKELVPNLYNYFVDQGIAIGYNTPIIASGPNHLSLPGYLEITRGHPSYDCQNNDCSNIIIDRSILSIFDKTVVFASWLSIKKILPKNVYSDIGPEWYRSDSLTEIKTLEYLNSHNVNFLWVALGDTDEFAHQNNYSLYLQALSNADKFIGNLVRLYPQSTFIITCDHGRSSNFKDHGLDPSSGRVWLMMRGPTVPIKGIVNNDLLSLSNIYDTVVSIKTNILNNSIINHLH